MKPHLRLLTLSFLCGTVFLSGCAFRGNPLPFGQTKKAVSRCDNNQYWDGETCRHKGKGHGARKHDG